MLLGIPGDNTYSNLAEAQRIFWRATVLPLVNRLSLALSHWLAPAYANAASPPASRSVSGLRPDTAAAASPLRLVPDLDSLEALASEREALRASLEKTSFLTADEKRAAIGYGPTEGPRHSESKFNPDQPRIPAGLSGGGQWTSGSTGDEPDADSETQTEDSSDPLLHQVAKKPGGLPKEVWGFTVRQFVSRYCKGTINRELPAELEHMTISDVLNLAKGGDKAARTCKKLLERQEYRK